MRVYELTFTCVCNSIPALSVPAFTSVWAHSVHTFSSNAQTGNRKALVDIYKDEGNEIMVILMLKTDINEICDFYSGCISLLLPDCPSYPANAI